jgi:hypothetical protein
MSEDLLLNLTLFVLGAFVAAISPLIRFIVVDCIRHPLTSRRFEMGNRLVTKVGG